MMSPRWGRLTGLLVRGLPGFFVLAWLTFWLTSRDAVFALIAAAAQSAAITLLLGVTAGAGWASRPLTARGLALVLAAWALPLGLFVALLLAALGVAAQWDAIAGLAVFGAAAAFHARHLSGVRGLQDQSPLVFMSVATARGYLTGRRRAVVPLGHVTLPASAAAIGRLNRAKARVVVATREADHDELITAVRDLREALADTADPGTALLSVDALVTAESMLAQRSRDGRRYEQAVEWYARLAERSGIAGARASAHANRADFAAFEMMLASDDEQAAEAAGDQDEATRAHRRVADAFRATERELSAAIHLTPEGAEIFPQYLGNLGLHLDLSGNVLGEDRTDEGIALVRAALAHPAGRSREQRPLLKLSLGQVLLARWMHRSQAADRAGDVTEADLDEAEGLLSGLLKAESPVKARAWRLMLEVSARSTRQRSLPVPAAAREAFAAGLADATSDLIPVADLFTDWAERTRAHPAVRADAYWMRSVATAWDAMRRELPPSRLRILADSQDLAAEAAYWLARTKRVTDAVIAIEQSRAILLTRLAGILAPEMTRGLLAAARPDLVSEYLAALRARADAYRHQFGQQAGDDTSGTPSELEVAQARLIQLNRQVAAVMGDVDPLGLPSYPAIQAAATTAPVLYLAAAEDGGLALLVRGTGDPWHAEVPALTRSSLAGYSAAFRAPKVSSRAVRASMDWLTTRVLPLVIEQIAHDREIVVVPVGDLTLLPVNGALMAATAGRPRGPVCVRYLPNARAATQEQQPWRLGPAGTTTLVIDVARPTGWPPLLLAQREAQALAGRPGARRITDATIAEVLSALPGFDIVQFFCHGKADAADPLAGGLVVHDGMLTVQQLFRRLPARRQLVIVAACESHVAGTAAIDEVIGFPAALHQAGASGVIAAQWEVDERAAAVVLRQLNDRLAAGTPPPHALAQAQDWLRTATRSALARQYPDLYRTLGPAGSQPDDLDMPHADPVDWAAFAYTGQ
jgi:hypothetical protein